MALFGGVGGGGGGCDREEETGVGGQMVRYTFYYFEVARFASVRFVDFRSEYCESNRNGSGLSVMMRPVARGVGEGCDMSVGGASWGGDGGERVGSE